MNCVFDKILWFQRNNTSSAQLFCFCCKNSGGKGVGREGIRGVDVAVDINGICFRERCGLNSFCRFSRRSSRVGAFNACRVAMSIMLVSSALFQHQLTASDRHSLAGLIVLADNIEDALSCLSVYPFAGLTELCERGT